MTVHSKSFLANQWHQIDKEWAAQLVDRSAHESVWGLVEWVYGQRVENIVWW